MRTDRLQSLDVLRGVAILGTLGTNIWIFTDPRGAAGFLALPSPDSLDGWVEVLLRSLSNGKFLALLSILFGVGLELQYRSAKRRGVRWPGWYLWRSALLLLEGTLHYLLIFEFDVLMYYAVVSVLVAYLIGRKRSVIHGWMIFQSLSLVAAVGGLTALMTAGPGLGSGGGTDSWPGQVTERITMAGTYRAEAILVIPLSVTLFLLGSQLLRAGALESSLRGRIVQRRMMWIGFGVGLPIDLLAVWSGPQWFFVDRYLAAPVVAVGLLALITRLVHRLWDEPGLVRRGLTAVGRMALSSYILQNLVASVLCYGWGFGLAVALDGSRPWWVIGAYAGVSVVFVAFAMWWMRRFSRGPVELAWQWAYLAPQRRKRPGPPVPGPRTQAETDAALRGDGTQWGARREAAEAPTSGGRSGRNARP